MEGSLSNYTTKLFQKQPKTLELFVREKKVLDTREVHSTESSLNLCYKEEILQNKTELEENPFMARNLLTKTSKLVIPNLDYCQWLMLDRIPTDPNSSSLQFLAHISMESTSSLDKLLTEWTL